MKYVAKHGLSDRTRARTVVEKAYEAYKGGGMEAGDNVARGVDRKVSAAMEEAERAAQDMGAQATSVAVKSADRAYYVAIAGTVAAMLASLVLLYFFIRRAVLAPISTAVRFSERLAEGDLTADIRSGAKDETGHLLRMMGKMKESIVAVVSQVRSSADSVVTASSQVSASAQGSELPSNLSLSPAARRTTPRPPGSTPRVRQPRKTESFMAPQIPANPRRISSGVRHASSFRRTTSGTVRPWVLQ